MSTTQKIETAKCGAVASNDKLGISDIRIATQNDFNEFLRRPHAEWWEAAAILCGYAIPQNAANLLNNVNRMPAINGYPCISTVLKSMKIDHLMPNFNS